MRISACIFFLFSAAMVCHCQSSQPCPAVDMVNGEVGTRDCDGKFTPTKHQDQRGVGTVDPAASDSKEAKAKADQLRVAQYDFQIWELDQTRRAFSWHHSSGIIIFGVVIGLVASGLYFAAVQFNLGIRHRRVSEPSGSESEVTKIEFTGFKISSSVLGVIILAISMGFFYLYLVHVYPIRTFGPEQPSKQELGR